MRQICEEVSVARGANGASQLSTRFAAAPAERRAAPTHLEAAHGAAASPMREGVGVKGRRVLIKGGTILSMDERVGNFAAAGIERDLFRA